MDDLIVCDTPDKVYACRMLALKGALKMECFGMRMSRGPSAFATIKEETGLKARSAKELMPKYLDWLREAGILVD